MPKQLNVNLRIGADVEQAKAAILDVQKSLQKLATSTSASPQLFNAQQLKEASQAAAELQRHLMAATDVNTGKLNLSSFSASLKSANTTLDAYKKKLEAIGPEGEAAFLKVSKSIATADAPLRKTNAYLTEFATTLKNTARWQISSSILHGFIGTIQSAYGYAQNLNESLNNIRIVTGQNIDQMAQFADQANRAAKLLSATTLDYTKASLIYYQQGLSDSEVQARTDVTIKMANAARESAETISQELTSVWNNFATGSDNLEHFADVMVKLGAETASSSKEIADGIQKFASIGQTVGLSYEYAASALATITATTRESADVVGTALKTLFSRLEGLKLGETLDDGTDLNKYSQALAAVGVQIKDTYGNLKDADTILDETAAKWETLDRAEKMALAQTVAGVRQYAQFMALMENWDFMEENIQRSRNADGALQQQADTYAESWEAAQKRVKAALQSIYATLIDDKFFISLSNAFATLLDGVKGLIDGFGGVKSILLTVASIFTQKYARDVHGILERIYQDFLQITNVAKSQAQIMQENNYRNIIQPEAQSSMNSFQEGQGSLQYAAEANVLELIAQKKLQLNEYTNQYSAKEREAAEQEIHHLEQISDLLSAQGARFDDLNQKSSIAYDNLIQRINSVQSSSTEQKARLIEIIDEIQDLARKSSQLNQLSKAFSKLDIGQEVKSLDNFKTKLLTIAKSANSVDGNFSKLVAAIQKIDTSSDNAQASLEQVAKTLQKDLGDNATASTTKLESLQNEFTGFGATVSGVGTNQLTAFIKILQDMGLIAADVPLSLTNVGLGLEQLKPHAASGMEALMSFSGALMSCQAFINSMSGLKNVFTDEDSTTIQKIGAVVGALTSAFMVYNAITKVTTTLKALENAQHEKTAIALLLETISRKGAAKVMTDEQRQEMGVVAAKIADIAATLGLEGAMAPLLIVTLALVAAMLALTAIIAGVVAIVKKVKAESPEGQLKAAKEEAEKLTTALSDAKTEAQELNDAINNLESAQENLKNATKGTKEWRDALQEVNSQCLDLINQFPELASALEGNAATGYSVNADALEAAQNKANTKVFAAQKAAAAGQAQAREAQMVIDQQDLADDFAKTFNKTDFSSQVWSSYIDDAGNSHTVNATASAGRELAKHSAELAGLGGTELANQISSILSDAGYEFNEGLATEMAEVIETSDLTNGLQELSNAMRENTAAIDASNSMVASSVLAGNDTIQNAKNGSKVLSASGNLYGALYNDAYDQILADASDRTMFNAHTAKSQDVWEQYADLMGIDRDAITNYKGSGKSSSFVYKDENDEEIEVSSKMVAATLAAAEASGQLDDAAQNLLKTFNQLENSASAADHALSDFLSGDLQESTRGEFDDISNDITLDEDGHISSDSATTYLGSKFGGEDSIISDEEAIAMGYESADAMITAFVEEFNNASDAWKDIHIPESLNNEFASGMSLNTAQAVEKTFDQLKLGPAGQSAADDFVNGLEVALAKIDPEDQQAALSALMEVDWSSWDAMEQADAVLQDFGTDTSVILKEFPNFIDDIRTASGAMRDFTSLKTDLASVSKILGSLNFGDTIKDDDYNTLIAYKDAWKDYFILQSDGSRKFIGNSQQMLQATRDEINESRQDLALKKEAAEELEKWGHQENGAFVAADWSEHANGLNDGEDNDTGSFNTARNLANATGPVRDFLDDLGYTQDVINQLVDTAEKGGDEGAEAMGQLAEMFKRMSEESDPARLTELDAELNEMYASTATNVEQLNQMLVQGDVDINAYNKRLSEMAGEAAKNATSLAELQSAMGQLGGSTDISQDTNNNAEFVNYDEYANGLLNIASQYESCSAAAVSYQNALQLLSTSTGEVNEETRKAVTEAQNHLEAMIGCEEAASKYGLESDTLAAQMREIQKESEGAANGEKLTEKQALALAVANQRMNRGVASLVNNWSDWKKILKSSDKTAEDYAATLADVSDSVQDLVGWYEDLSLDSEFVETNMELIDKAAAGDVTAIMQLGAAVASLSISQAELNTTMAFGAMADGGENAFQKWSNDALSAQENFANLQTSLTSTFNTIQESMDQLEAGASLQDVLGGEGGVEAFVEQLNAYAAATGMTATEMQSMLSSIGVTANVQTDYQEQEVTTPVYEEHSVQTGEETYTGTDAQGNETTFTSPIIKRYSVPLTPEKHTGFVEVASISMDGAGEAPGISAPTFTGKKPPSNTAKSGGTGNSGGKSGGGGGGGKPKTKDTPERYHENIKQLDTLQKAYDKVNKAKDRLYGASKIKQINAEIEATDNLIAAQNDYLTAIEKNIEPDKTAMIDAVKAYTGLDVQIGDDGNISNWTEIMNKAKEVYDTTNADDEEADDKYEKFEKAITQYEDTISLYLDEQATLQDLINQRQDEFLEKLQHTLEYKLQIDENDLKYIETTLRRFEGNFAKIGEMMALAMTQFSSMDSKHTTYQQNFDETLAAYSNKDISQAGFMEQMQTIFDGAMDEASALMDYDEQILNYYVETVDQATALLQPYTDSLEHINSVIESYTSIVELANRSDKNYYKTKDKLLQASAKNLKNEYDVAKANYTMLSNQRAAMELEWEKVKNDPSNDMYYKIKADLDAITTAQEEAEETMLSNAEAWATTLQDIYHNTLESIREDMDMELSGGMGLDSLIDSMSNLSTYQDEYLTKTNQIYETNKMLRTLQKDMDKTTNTSAKQKYSAFAKEIEQLQEKDELSNLELEIAQAKYKQLQAQIALEEAQNAKTTVRLTQDSEGNYGYVYTADQSKVNDAEQGVEDANNELYNIYLKARTDYANKSVQLSQEYLDKIDEINNNEKLSAEEKEKEIQRINEEYGNISKAYLELWRLDDETDVEEFRLAVTDAYTRSYDNIIENSNIATTNLTGNLNKITEANKQLDIDMGIVADHVGTDYDTIATKTGELTTKSDALANEIQNDVIPLMNDGLQDALDETTRYINTQRDAVQELIDKYLDLASAAQAAMDAESSSDTPGAGAFNDNLDYSDLIGTMLNNGYKSTDKVIQILEQQRQNKIDYHVSKGEERYNDYARGEESIDSFYKGLNLTLTEDEMNDLLKQLGLQSYGTGGYTGSWGTSGKLAMLHEKELVLNEIDTSNLLKTVDLVRQITAALDVSALGQKLALGNLAASTVNDNREVIEQVVSITAEFPNARDRNEIEAAFGNILNRASQYANR